MIESTVTTPGQLTPGDIVHLREAAAVVNAVRKEDAVVILTVTVFKLARDLVEVVNEGSS